jgi:ribonucleoside-diphosphate reductase alpha chain
VTTLVERKECLSGKTYKITNGVYSYYITVNCLKGKPYEIFINSKNPEKYASLTCLTRIVSAFMRTDYDCAFIADELKQIVDPKGGYWKKSKYYTSLESEIGEILATYYR